MDLVSLLDSFNPHFYPIRFAVLGCSSLLFYFISVPTCLIVKQVDLKENNCAVSGFGELYAVLDCKSDHTPSFEGFVGLHLSGRAIIGAAVTVTAFKAFF